MPEPARSEEAQSGEEAILEAALCSHKSLASAHLQHGELLNLLPTAAAADPPWLGAVLPKNIR